MNESMSALELYFQKVHKIILLLAPGACMCAGATYTIEKLIGWYPTVNWISLIIFDITTVVYLLIGIYFAKVIFDDDGSVIKHKAKGARIFLFLHLVVQWNYISYMIPSVDFWGYAFFFVILTAFSFDTKLVTATTIGILVSIFVSWFVRGEILTSPHDALFFPNMAMRVICFVLSLGSIIMLTYFAEHYLVEALDKNANYDVLTHLLNRKTMDKVIWESYDKAKSGGQTFCLFLVDIDNFKKINDTYGHFFGDLVLKEVANIINRGVQSGDFVFRFGGEEILVVIYAPIDISYTVADRIRERISKAKFTHEDKDVAVSITVGMSEFDGSKTITQMLEETDANLYKGKGNGKNQVVKTMCD